MGETMIRLSLLLFILGFGCQQSEVAPRSGGSSKKDKEEEEKAEKSGTKPPTSKDSELKLRFSWDGIDDDTIISFRVSREDKDGDTTLVKEWSADEVDAENPSVVLELDKALSADSEEEEVCFVLSAVSDGGESEPTKKILRGPIDKR
jgi:hypothetical protein